MTRSKIDTSRSSGPSVDAQGYPVADPTTNVLQILATAVTRQDDLREAEMIRQDELRKAAEHHLEAMAELRSDHYAALRKAEADRLDAIRASDAAVVNRAAEVQQQQAIILANQVNVSAETLRTQVQATANSATVALAAALEPIKKDIGDLRRSQYEAQGQRIQVGDTQETSAANKQSIGLYIAIIVAIFSVLFGVIGIVFAIIEALRV